MANRDVSRFKSLVIGTIKRIKLEVDDVSEKLNKESKEQKKESITILGILASIVTVLVASIGLLSAIFSNMNSVDTWKLYALTCLIVLFITNIFVLLLDFLRDIVGEDDIGFEKNNKEYLEKYLDLGNDKIESVRDKREAVDNNIDEGFDRIKSEKKDNHKHEYLWILNTLLIIVSFFCFIISINEQIPLRAILNQSVENCTIRFNSDSFPKP